MRQLSILESQLGYHVHGRKKVMLRSPEHYCPDLEGLNFVLLEKNRQTNCFTGKIAYWGQKWHSHWWVLDFSEFAEPGSYYVEVRDIDMCSLSFEISDPVFFDNKLIMIALDQLDCRRTEGVPGWRDCGSQIRELSSMVITVHGLIDILNNKTFFEKLDKNTKDRLIESIIYGAKYIVYSQEKWQNPEMDGRFNHDAGRRTDYGTTDFHNWHDTAYAITGLVRAYQIVKSIDPPTAGEFLECARKAYDNAVYRPYNLDSDIGSRTNPEIIYDDNFFEVVNKIARVLYNKPDDWSIPRTLKTKDKLTFTWACTLLYEATGEEKYINMAACFADKAAERQFTDFENPIDGAFGNFYEFEGDDEAFMLEWGHSHKFLMGNIEPCTLRGFIDLIKYKPDDIRVATWYNVIRTYGKHYVKATQELTPFGIYPVSAYKDNRYGGIKFFQVITHGATALYGQIAKNIMEIGSFLGDSSYQHIAENNLQFVAGLNPGFPNAYDETLWEGMSLIKGVGKRWFGGEHQLETIPDGSAMNGFSAAPQFVEKRIDEVEDRPAGILKPDGSFYFNEDYLPHSHGYVSGAALVEGNSNFRLETFYKGKPVDAETIIILENGCRLYPEASVTGLHEVKDLAPLQKCVVITKYKEMFFEKEFDTLSNGAFELKIDFSRYLTGVINVPEVIAMGTEAYGCVIIRNEGLEPVKTIVKMCSDGVSLDISDFEVSLKPGEIHKEFFTVRTCGKIKPFMIYVSDTGENHALMTIGEGFIVSCNAYIQKKRS